MIENFISQSHIFNYIDKKARDTFPRSLLVIGESGCGKSIVINYIAEHLHLPLLDITDQLSFDFIMSLYEKPEPYFYFIDGNKLSIKDQNMLLKFIEEPLKNAFICIELQSANQVLPTIYNRCQKIIFNPYSKAELERFTQDPLILQVAKTPGQIIKLTESNQLPELLELSNKIIDKIGSANISNVLTISDKLAFKQEKDKLNVDLFSNILVNQLNNRIKTNSNSKLFSLYQLVREWNIKRKAPTIVQNFLFEQYLVKMYKLMRG